jgi:hypothetical protein
VVCGAKRLADYCAGRLCLFALETTELRSNTHSLLLMRVTRPVGSRPGEYPEKLAGIRNHIEPDFPVRFHLGGSDASQEEERTR